ncbi:MAG: aspartate kinase [Deltaproteobacteria bacterium]|nr:aspartate kinase [Deltaproteobacteria bacterium]
MTNPMTNLIKNRLKIQVFRFGGNGLCDAGDLGTAVRLILDAAKDSRLIVVATGICDTEEELFKAGVLAGEGNLEGSNELLSGVKNKYLRAWADLFPPGRKQEIDPIFDEVEELIHGVRLLAESSPRVLDRMRSAASRAAAQLLKAGIRAGGQDARVLETGAFIETDGTFGRAIPLSDVVNRAIRARIKPLLQKGTIPVLTGGCGRAPDGATTTFGRGGGDLTSTLVALAMDARSITLWTGSPGIPAADQSIVPKAPPLDHLHYREAAELSFFSSGLLHPGCLVPLAQGDMEMTIKSIHEPEGVFTKIDGRITEDHGPVRAVHAMVDHVLLSIEGKGMAGMAGMAAKVFSCLAEQEISVTMFSQSSSESSICLAIRESHAGLAQTALRRGLDKEMLVGQIDDIVVMPGVGLVTVVGMGMAGNPGTAGRIFSALARAGVNILAIAQGAMELSISIAVKRSDVTVAVKALCIEFDIAGKKNNRQSGYHVESR